MIKSSFTAPGIPNTAITDTSNSSIIYRTDSYGTALRVSSGGSGANLSPTIVSGQITGINIVNGGYNYVNNSLLTFNTLVPGNGAAGYIRTNSSGTIISANITSRGSNYSSSNPPGVGAAGAVLYGKVSLPASTFTQGKLSFLISDGIVNAAAGVITNQLTKAIGTFVAEEYFVTESYNPPAPVDNGNRAPNDAGGGGNRNEPTAPAIDSSTNNFGGTASYSSSYGGRGMMSEQGKNGTTSSGGYSFSGGGGASVSTGGIASNGCFAKGTLFKMADGTFKAIEDIKVGDIMFTGGRVLSIIIGDGNLQEWYLYKNVKVTGYHPVLDSDGIWRRVKDSKQSIKTFNDEFFYTLINENNRMISDKNITFTDYLEVSSKDNLEDLNELKYSSSEKELSNLISILNSENNFKHDFI